MSLPTLSERKRRHATEAMTILSDLGFETRMAGGCVRDNLLGIEPHDYDLATTALPNQATEAFEASNIKVIPTGLDHGTITVVMKSGPVEITTLRTDKNPDGRHADVSFVEDFQKDAARRDFTINAMSEDASGKIYDYFSGKQDLKEKKLRFVGEASSRIKEDYLRIMRYFRFQARFSFSSDVQTLDAIKTNREGLKQVSQERITSEFLKLLQSNSTEVSLKEMIAAEILPIVLPEISISKNCESRLISMIELLSTIPETARGICRLSVFLKLCLNQEEKTPAAIGDISLRLKLSRAENTFLTFCVRFPEFIANSTSSQAETMELVDTIEKNCGKDSFPSFMLAFGLLTCKESESRLRQIDKTESLKGHIRKTKIPVSGNDLQQKFNLKAGPKLGIILIELKRLFREEKWSTKEQGLQTAKALIERAES